MQNTHSTEAFAGQVVSDIAAGISGVMTSIGHKLGLYKAMAGAGALTSAALAGRTSLHERYVREWLGNQVAGGYIDYDPVTRSYQLPDEHVPVLADDDSPVFLVPALDVTASLWFDLAKVQKVFRTGEGIPWGDHHHGLFCGSAALFRPGYRASLVNDWIAALDGMDERLRNGGRIADVGCGHGASSIVLAEHYPNSEITGIDSHVESIAIAKAQARQSDANGNLKFEVATAKGFAGSDFDLVMFMDCLHDMGDPVGAARHARQALRDDGKLLLVEPAANDALEDNVNPVSRLYYAASAGICTPCSISQETGAALGAQAGPAQLADVLKEAGFRASRIAVRTPFNIVIEASA